MHNIKVNKFLDWAERTFWTFTGVLLVQFPVDSISNINLSLLHKLEIAAGSALFTTVKVLIAQHTGNSGMGDAIPGADVIESQ
jgi:hypothetical protein